MRADRLLVAGNGARGEDHAVALVQRHLRMVVAGDPRQRRARLALAARAQRQHLVRRKMAVEIRAAEILHAIEIAGLARDLHHALHGAADHDDLAVGGFGGIRDGPDARDVGRKGRHGDPALGGLHELGDRLGDLGFRGRAAVAHRIGGIADQRQHAGIAELAQPPLVGRQADDRGRVDLPVAGVQHGADLGVDRQRVRFRNRMRDRNELDVERADIDAAARRHHRDRNLRRIALGLAFGLEQGGAELASHRSGICSFGQRSMMAPKWSSWAWVSTRPTRFFRSFSRKLMSGMIRSMPGRCSSSPKETPRSTASQERCWPLAEAIDRQVHADLADAAERRKGQFVRPRHQLAPAEAAEPK